MKKIIFFSGSRAEYSLIKPFYKKTLARRVVACARMAVGKSS